MTLWAVLAASLVGSLHCAAMCGGFAAMCGGARPGQSAGKLETITYSLGRGLAYTGLGALAGGLGAGIDLAGMSMAGLRESAALLLGAMLIGLGLWSLWGRTVTAVPLVTLGASKQPPLLDRGRLALGRLLQRSGPSAALGVGLLSALLPCAWLWSFLAASAATGAAGDGALTMFVFWAGTVPALSGVGLLAGTLGRTLGRKLGRHAPRIVAVIMIGLGAAALVGRATMPVVTGGEPCHVESESE